MSTDTETRDFGLEAQKAAEEHVMACQAALDFEDYGDYYTDAAADEEFEAPEFPENMAAPYCGCETCVIRETLHAGWPILLEAAKSWLFHDLGNVDPALEARARQIIADTENAERAVNEATTGIGEHR